MGNVTYEQRNFDIGEFPKSWADFASGKAFKAGDRQCESPPSRAPKFSTYSVSFTEPYINDKPIGLDVVGSSWERWRESYDEGRTKGFVGFNRRFRTSGITASVFVWKM